LLKEKGRKPKGEGKKKKKNATSWGFRTGIEVRGKKKKIQEKREFGFYPFNLSRSRGECAGEKKRGGSTSASQFRSTSLRRFNWSAGKKRGGLKKKKKREEGEEAVDVVSPDAVRLRKKGGKRGKGKIKKKKKGKGPPDIFRFTLIVGKGGARGG